MDLSAYYDQYWIRIGDACDVKRLELLLQHIEPGERVLEVDCGAGVLAKLMAEKGAIVEATDMSAVAVERARAKGISARRADLDSEPLPYPDEEFEVVVSNSAIEHRFFHEKNLDECVRVLKPGGKLILCLPNIGHWHCRLWLLMGRFPYVHNSPTDVTHLRFFTVHEAKVLCERRGIEVVHVDGSASLWVKGFYSEFFRRRPISTLYEKLAHVYPSLFARDFIVVGRKRGSRCERA